MYRDGPNGYVEVTCGHVLGYVDGVPVHCGSEPEYQGFCWAHRWCTEYYTKSPERNPLMSDSDLYWANYESCLDKIRDEGSTVADVIRICREHFGRSVGDAFFPGGADRDLLGTLDKHGGWRITWMKANDHYQVADRNGARLEYVEGDLYDEEARKRVSS
jgi:hypothetical protein